MLWAAVILSWMGIKLEGRYTQGVGMGTYDVWMRMVIFSTYAWFLAKQNYKYVCQCLNVSLHGNLHIST